MNLLSILVINRVCTCRLGTRGGKFFIVFVLYNSSNICDLKTRKENNEKQGINS